MIPTNGHAAYPSTPDAHQGASSLAARLPSHDWSGLYRVGGVAALLAGVIFRRNFGVEVALFATPGLPETVVGWFDLLQRNRFLALLYLNLFDMVNYVLLAVVFVALGVALMRDRKVAAVNAVALGFIGFVVGLASNTAFSMLALSDPYATATAVAQRAELLAAGQALLALNRFSSAGSHPGSGGYMSLLLIGIAAIMMSVAMVRAASFTRASAYVGMVAGALDVAYCGGYLLLPATQSDLLAVAFIPAAGLFWMVWHILIGLGLLRLSRVPDSV